MDQPVEPAVDVPPLAPATPTEPGPPTVPEAEGDHPVQQLIFMELKMVLEALLFSSQKPLSVTELRNFLNQAAAEDGATETVRAFRKLPPEQLAAALATLAADHEAAGRSYRLVCIGGAWQFVTQPEFAPWLRVMLGVKNRPARLSQAALETLAIIAYRQPITRAEMEQIRGVAVDGTIATLVERQLIAQAGRAEVIGRPMQYATTPAFLEYFGLSALSALPAADELRRIPVLRPESLQTIDPGLATVAPEQLQQMTLDQAEGSPPGTPAIVDETAIANPEIPSGDAATPPTADQPETPAS